MDDIRLSFLNAIRSNSHAAACLDRGMKRMRVDSPTHPHPEPFAVRLEGRAGFDSEELKR